MHRCLESLCALRVKCIESSSTKVNAYRVKYIESYPRVHRCLESLCGLMSMYLKGVVAKVGLEGTSERHCHREGDGQWSSKKEEASELYPVATPSTFALSQDGVGAS